MVEVICSIFIQKDNEKEKYIGIVHTDRHIENYSAATLEEALDKQATILHTNLILKEIK